MYKKPFHLWLIFFIIFGQCLLANSTHGQVIAGGGQHTIVICNDSTVKAWGSNYAGQLGNGSANGSLSPVTVNTISGIRIVTTGWEHSLALKNDSTVWAWGYNGFGQLGNGKTANSNIPVKVNLLTGVVAIGWGHLHTHSLAVKSDGSAWTWGRNALGQLGDGSTNQRSNPVQVHGQGNKGFLTDVKAVGGGHDFSLALKNDGTVWAWGANSFGQLGNGGSSEEWAPVKVANLTGITAITLGDWTAYALKNDSTVWAWGYNGAGRLGDNSNTPRQTPVKVLGKAGVGFLKNITAIAAGESHILALKSDGTVWAWGKNADGELGDSTVVERWTPVQLKKPGGNGFLTNIIAITAGAHHSVALKNDGTLWAWGDNAAGQLGDGTTFDRATPVQVLKLCNLPIAVNSNTKPLNFSIFPNPSNGIFNLKFENAPRKLTLKIFNTLGEKIYEERISDSSDREINLNHVSAGIYFFKMDDGEKQFIKKLVIR